MLSFEEKKAIFHSFKLKEKKIGNGKVSFVYPESVQKGQVLATQIHPSGNGYVIGKYMSEETIKKHGYQVDPRGWISIKVFSQEEIAKVITEAIKSMSGGHVEALLAEVEEAVGTDEKLSSKGVGNFEKNVSVEDEHPLETAEEVVDGTVEVPEIVDFESFESPTIEKSADKSGSDEKKKIEGPVRQDTYEFYPGSCLFAWMGLTLSTMEYGYLVWKKTFRNIVGDISVGDKE